MSGLDRLFPVAGDTARSLIRSVTCFSRSCASLMPSGSPSSSATWTARRALMRPSTRCRQVRRRTPIPGSMSHQAVAPISIADRASTLGPMAGMGSPMRPRMLPRLSRTPVISRLAAPYVERVVSSSHRLPSRLVGRLASSRDASESGVGCQRGALSTRMPKSTVAAKAESRAARSCCSGVGVCIGQPFVRGEATAWVATPRGESGRVSGFPAKSRATHRGLSHPSRRGRELAPRTLRRRQPRRPMRDLAVHSASARPSGRGRRSWPTAAVHRGTSPRASRSTDSGSCRTGRCSLVVIIPSSSLDRADTA